MIYLNIGTQDLPSGPHFSAAHAQSRHATAASKWCATPSGHLCTSCISEVVTVFRFCWLSCLQTRSVTDVSWANSFFFLSSNKNQLYKFWLFQLVQWALPWSHHTYQPTKHESTQTWNLCFARLMHDATRIRWINQVEIVRSNWQIERIMSISSMFCMRTNLVTEPDTAWQGIRSCIENYAGRPFEGTFGTHYSKPISLFWSAVRNG